jgi:RHS repeat-associated protein
VKTTFPDSTYATKSYDSTGNLLSSTDPSGKTTTFSYDSANRLVTTTYPDSSTVNYLYDKSGNKLSETEQAGSFYYAYDARNRLTNETDVLGGAKYTTLYNYDNAGNVLKVTYPDGYALSYSYDAQNRVATLGTFASFTYNTDDSMKTIAYGNGVSSTYTYDSRARVTRILATSGVTYILDLSYAYDNVGNVLTIGSETYSYDWLNRLTASSGPWGTTSYTYDSAGNMLSQTKNSVVTTYTYGANIRLTKAGNVTFAYNANGDTTQVVNGSTTRQYGYDYADRLTTVTKNSQLVQTNAYSSNGNRVEQTQGTSSVVYAYQGLHVIYEKNLTSGAVTDRFYANGLQLAKVVAGTTAYYMINDALGSTRLVTTANAVTSFSSNYQPFGPSYGLSGVEEFMYTGKMMDSITGLYYFGARFYDDAIGRFITEDSSSGSLADPLSLNRYIYARDNPEAITDQTGHDWWSSLTKAVSNTVVTVKSAVSTVTSAVSNAWNSLPPQAKTGIIIGITIAVAVATVGAALPAVAAAVSASAVGDVALTAVGVGAAAVGLPVVTLTTDTAPELDPVILTQLASMTRGQRASVAQNLLADTLGGDKEVVINADSNPVMTRRSDVFVAPNTSHEMKFGNDPLTMGQLTTDMYLNRYGGTVTRSQTSVDSFNVPYDFVPDPVTGEHTAPNNMDLLDKLGIPYKVWGTDLWNRLSLG